MALTRDAVFWDGFVAHARCTVEAAALLRRLLGAPAEAAALAGEIKRLESEGDRIAHEVIRALHRTWITPLSRDEIHEFVKRLDDILDFVEAAADRFALYELRDVLPGAIELADELSAAARDVSQAVNMLPRLRDGRPLLDLCVSINAHENRADDILRSALAGLLRDGADALQVMKWRDVLDSMEIATDRAEDVADLIESLVLEHGG